MYRKFIGITRNVRWLVGILIVFGAVYVLNQQKILSDYYIQLIMLFRPNGLFGGIIPPSSSAPPLAKPMP